MKSIGFKLWAGMMALVAVVLVLLWLFQIVFLESFYSNLKISDMQKKGVALAQQYGAGKTEAFVEEADKLAYDNNLSINLVDLNGNDIYLTTASENGQMMMAKSNARAEALQKAAGGAAVVVEMTHPRFGNKFMLYAIPVKASGTLAAVLLINMPMAPVKDTVSILKRQLVFITLIMLAAALLISYRMSKSFIKPILEIKNVSEKMAAGDFESRIQSKRRDEIGALAVTINEMGQELSKIEQLRKDLIANVSHELRTPLSIIRGYAETIRDVSGNNPEKRDKHLEIILDESERLKRLVDDILNFSQMQDGRASLEKSGFMLGQMVDGVVRRYGLLCDKTGIQVRTIIDSELAVIADEKRIEQVMYNLVNNAFNHTPDGGTIEIRALKNGGKAKIELSDTGEGIPEQELRHVWDRFYQAGQGGIRKTIGTGLGLAIVKNILEAHNVEYGVRSKHGEGTTFWFDLDLQEQA